MSRSGMRIAYLLPRISGRAVFSISAIKTLIYDQNININ